MTAPASNDRKLRVALLYRYGVHDHKELYPIIPEVLRQLGRQCEALYMGPNRRRAGIQYRFPGVSYRFLPFTVNRASTFDKITKALLWYACLPFVAFFFRFVWRADLIWIDESSLPAQGRLMQMISGRPLAITVCDFFLSIYSEKISWLRPWGIWLNAIDQKSWLKAAGLFTRSESLRRYLLARGVSPERVVVARDAVLPDLFVPGDAAALRRKLGFGDADVVLCHHGILHPNKGILRVVRWMLPIMKSDPHLKLLIIGGGPDLEPLRELVRKNQLQNQIILTGWLASHAEVNAHLNAADIGLVMRVGQSSDHFHVTGALIHSMMCALPVLACRLEGIQEIVTEGQEGVLFDPDSAGEFLQKLDVLKQNAARRREMGQKGRTKALAEFNPEHIAKQTVETLIRFARRGRP
ncbi:MAG: glycosyltransferase [Verrucomicrobia bacterium]|nr:glycosyltransferase [Verrucomicrobiota bacterium]MBU4291522.1 glycosyltransferase [Verrucomicrobiota bacterium]MBU4429091.1 glycosyltransferase [Verrucomicrobiota bacterium]MCG2678645.1 glycosyltransferase [Kiritimatiellia bacterium]